MDLTLELFDYFVRKKYTTVHNGNWNPRQIIRKIQLWDGSTAEQDILYLYVDALSAPFSEKQHPFLHVLRLTTQTDITDIGYYLCCQEKDTLSIVNDLLDIYHRYHKWKEDVLRFNQYEHNLQALINCAADYFKMGIRIISKDYQNQFADDYGHGMSWGDILDEQNRMTVQSIQDLYFEDPMFDETFLQHGLVEYQVSFSEQYATFYYNIFEHGKYIERILLTVPKEDSNPAFIRLLSAYCEHLENCFLYVQQREDSSSAFIHLREYLYKILQQQPADPAIIDSLLHNIKWNSSDRYEVLYFQSKGYITSQQTMQYFGPQIERILPHCIAFFDANGIYCIHNISADSSQDFHGKLPYFLRDNLFQVGISRVFSDFLHFIPRCREAETALQIGSQNQPERWIHYFEDHVLSYCLKQIQKDFPKEDLCHQAILTLAEYDADNPETELVNTLHQYIQCHFNASAAAEKLHIHRTTFLYRLRKIQDITHVDLDSGDHLLHIMLSYNILYKK